MAKVAIDFVEAAPGARVDVERPQPGGRSPVREQPHRKDAVHAQLRRGRAERRELTAAAQVARERHAEAGRAGGLDTRALVEPVLGLVQPGGELIGLHRGVQAVGRTHRDADQVRSGHDHLRGVDHPPQHTVHGAGVGEVFGLRAGGDAQSRSDVTRTSLHRRGSLAHNRCREQALRAT